MGGQAYNFSFSANCETLGGDLTGRSSFANVNRSFHAMNGDPFTTAVAGKDEVTNSCREQHLMHESTRGKPIIDDQSHITCYRNDGRKTIQEVDIAVENLVRCFDHFFFLSSLLLCSRVVGLSIRCAR